MSGYNKYTPGAIKRIGCSQCGQKGGHHAAYYPYNPDKQEAVKKRLEKGALALQFIDAWEAMAALRSRVDTLEKKVSTTHE